MLNAQDARAKRTAKALQAALLTLLEEKPLDQITVREITATAGINYATFFRHHSGKEALLDYLAADEMQKLVALTLPTFDALNMQTAVEELFGYIDSNRTLWKALLTGGAASRMREEMLRLSRLTAAERVKEDTWIPLDLAVNCAVSVVFELLVWWIDQSPEDYPIPKAAAILAMLFGMHGLAPNNFGLEK